MNSQNPYRIECGARREDWSGGISLYMRQRAHEGAFYVAEPLTLKTRAAGEFTLPMVTLDTTSAQQLMDELWGCGLRPSEGTGSAGSLAATERHLKDMQTIAMGLLRKEGVQA